MLIFFKAILAILVLYGATMIFVYYYQDAIIFQGKPLPEDHIFTYDQAFEEYTIPTDDKEEINAILFKTNKETANGIIIYSHGNSGNLVRWGSYAIDFTRLGYDVLMYDYRGYGKSSGKPSETVLYRDAEMIWDWANKNFDYPRWVVYGRSIGAAVASYLAGKKQADLLGLETPFDELNGAGGTAFLPFRLKYHFSNMEHLSGVQCKKFIIYGGSDFTVPASSTLRLKPFMKEGESFIRIPQGGHKNLRKFDLYHTKLAEMLKI
jgi:pimeloyl-ACP methyl ester carboxylesterase